jgi:hypothetical protein
MLRLLRPLEPDDRAQLAARSQLLVDLQMAGDVVVLLFGRHGLDLALVDIDQNGIQHRATFEWWA